MAEASLVYLSVFFSSQSGEISSIQVIKFFVSVVCLIKDIFIIHLFLF